MFILQIKKIKLKKKKNADDNNNDDDGAGYVYSRKKINVVRY